MRKPFKLWNGTKPVLALNEYSDREAHAPTDIDHISPAIPVGKRAQASRTELYVISSRIVVKEGLRLAAGAKLRLG